MPRPVSPSVIASREKIPIGARIIAACDAYTAMVSSRPYAGRRTRAEALSELRRVAGSQLDPSVVEAVSEEVAPEAAELGG